MFGFIYLLQTRDSFKNNESIYKVGRTEQDCSDSSNHHYPQGSKIYVHIYCFDTKVAEDRILEEFNYKYTNVPLYGPEYFEGDLQDMMRTIGTVICISCYKEPSINKFHKELQRCENTESNLREEIDNLQRKLEYCKREIEYNDEKNNVDVDKYNPDLICSKCNKLFLSSKGFVLHSERCEESRNPKQSIQNNPRSSRHEKYQHKIQFASNST